MWLDIQVRRQAGNCVIKVLVQIHCACLQQHSKIPRLHAQSLLFCERHNHFEPELRYTAFRTVCFSFTRGTSNAKTYYIIFFSWLTAPASQNLFFLETSWSYSDTTHSVGLLWTNYQPVAETSTWQHTNTHNRQTSFPTKGFEPAIPSRERSQVHALDRAATEIVNYKLLPHMHYDVRAV